MSELFGTPTFSFQAANVRNVDNLFDLKHAEEKVDEQGPNKKKNPKRVHFKNDAEQRETAVKPAVIEAFLAKQTGFVGENQISPPPREWWHYAGAIAALLFIVAALVWMLFYYP